MVKTDITADRVRELLNYDPETGIFTWRVDRRATARQGAIAGTIKPKGYRSIWIGSGHMAHRLAWLYVHGVWPVDQIDHINQVKDDNRIENLRLATHGENMQNRGRQQNNASGIRGVFVCKKSGRWTAQITANGKQRYIGRFDTAEDARAAYCAAAAQLHTHNPAANDSLQCAV